MKPAIGNTSAPVEVFSTPGTGRISQSHANCPSVFISAVMGCTLSTKPSSSKRKATRRRAKTSFFACVTVTLADAVSLK